MEDVDVAIVGGGVVGLASARAIAKNGWSTCILERHPRVGLESSTHNSGVIHAGIYYPHGSLKAKLCVKGREELYRFCKDYDIPHAKCGKLIVGLRDEDTTRLEQLSKQGYQNGVEDLILVNNDFIHNREPAVDARVALWSPSTGIVETESLIRALVKTIHTDNLYLLRGTKVEGGDTRNGLIELSTTQEKILARVVINAAGLYADELSMILGGENFKIYPVRGEYAELVPSSCHLINGLVYPLPDLSGHGLGIHFTRTTWNTVTVGPTARYQSAKDDYEANRLPLNIFYESALQLIPQLKINQLRLGSSGIRAKCNSSKEPPADFIIRRDAKIPMLIHAAGIDSPGLTACLAIGQMVAELVEETLN